MGSLMAGWSSSFEDPETVKFLRNKSLTRGEIDAFWKSKENKDERETKNFAKINQENMMHQISGEKPQRSSSLPLMDRRASILNSISRADAVKNIKNSGWWTRSDSAFLNELPVTEMEGPSYKYASQYHITRFDKKK